MSRGLSTSTSSCLTQKIASWPMSQMAQEPSKQSKVAKVVKIGICSLLLVLVKIQFGAYWVITLSKRVYVILSRARKQIPEGIVCSNSKGGFIMQVNNLGGWLGVRVRATGWSYTARCTAWKKGQTWQLRHVISAVRLKLTGLTVTKTVDNTLDCLLIKWTE